MFAMQTREFPASEDTNASGINVNILKVTEGHIVSTRFNNETNTHTKGAIKHSSNRVCAAELNEDDKHQSHKSFHMIWEDVLESPPPT